MQLTFTQDENDVEIIDGMDCDFPYVLHQRSFKDFYVPWHWHEELELNYIYKGSLNIETMEKTYTVRQGEAYFLNTNVMNSKKKTDENYDTIEHANIFHPILLKGHFRSIFETKYLNPILQDQSIELVVIKENSNSGKEILKYLKQIYDLRNTQNNEFQIRNLLSLAWLALIEEIKYQRDTNNNLVPKTKDRIKEMLSYINKNYSQKISVKDLADLVDISEKECTRLFKNTFCKPPIEYLMDFRLEQAKRLLKTTNFSITEIAYKTGFNNSAYFGKIFKKATNLTPKEYKQVSSNE